MSRAKQVWFSNRNELSRTYKLLVYYEGHDLSITKQRCVWYDMLHFSTDGGGVLSNSSLFMMMAQ